jgi:hypothetical protein
MSGRLAGDQPAKVRAACPEQRVPPIRRLARLTHEGDSIQ